jgi:8-oxo-dGTP pyrophosphatase MutT (NUDIX family)
VRTIHRDIVSAMIVSQDGKILLGKKDPSSGGVYPDCWHIPGGGIEKGEPYEEALRREILEEAGLDVANCRVELADNQGTGESTKTLKETNETVRVQMRFNVYRVDVPQPADRIHIQPGDDLVTLKWVERSDLGSYKLTPPSISLFKRERCL